jgi:hypothetical protein
VFAGFIEATLPLIEDIGARGHGPATVAEFLNGRGVPCFGRSRWTATDVRMVLSHGECRSAPRAPAR